MKPKKIKIIKVGSELIIEYKWLKLIAFFLVFCCIIWDGFLIILYNIISVGIENNSFILFLITHLVVALLLTYYTLALFINKTTIRVNRNSIEIKHSPLPWFRHKNRQIQNVEQIFIEKKKRASKNGAYHTYALTVSQKGSQNPIQLVDSLYSSLIKKVEDAQFIKKEIEQVLKG